MNFYEALELPCDLFQLMLKNSIVDSMQQTKEGQAYLADCKRLKTADADISALQQGFGIKTI